MQVVRPPDGALGSGLPLDHNWLELSIVAVLATLIAWTLYRQRKALHEFRRGLRDELRDAANRSRQYLGVTKAEVRDLSGRVAELSSTVNSLSLNEERNTRTTEDRLTVLDTTQRSLVQDLHTVQQQGLKSERLASDTQDALETRRAEIANLGREVDRLGRAIAALDQDTHSAKHVDLWNAFEHLTSAADKNASSYSTLGTQFSDLQRQVDEMRRGTASSRSRGRSRRSFVR